MTHAASGCGSAILGATGQFVSIRLLQDHEAAEQREFLHLAIDGADDAYDGADHQKEPTERQDGQPDEQGKRHDAEDLHGERRDQQDELLVGMKLRERAKLRRLVQQRNEEQDRDDVPYDGEGFVVLNVRIPTSGGRSLLLICHKRDPPNSVKW